jgi:hypothetical protein
VVKDPDALDLNGSDSEISEEDCPKNNAKSKNNEKKKN